jgi:hypothetical protein
MEFGLLWYDGYPQSPLTLKVERAAKRYQDKFGHAPNACFVHAASLERELEWRGVRVMGSSHVLPNHFWIGVSRQ